MIEHVDPSKADCIVRLRNVRQEPAELYRLAQHVDPTMMDWAKILRTTPTSNGECDVLLAVHAGWYREHIRGCGGGQDEIAAIGRRFHDDSVTVVEREYARVVIPELLPELRSPCVGPYAFAITWSALRTATVMRSVAEASGIAQDVRFTPVETTEVGRMTWAVSLPKTLFDDAYQIYASGMEEDLADAVFTAIMSAAAGKDLLAPLDPSHDEIPY